MGKWRIGCSGYHYMEWKGLFYPLDLPKTRWFQFYCDQFDTIELNTTFYRFPRAEHLQKWYQKSPDDFIFSVKAPRVITHFFKFRDAQRYLTDFYRAVDVGLKGKAGPLLFQFPSTYQFDAERLENIVALLDRSVPNVVEFRHASWWKPEVFDLLRTHNISFSGMSHPLLPDDFIRTGDILYYRYHGVPHLYASAYTKEEIQSVASRIGAPERTNIYIYFNNTAGGAAITNAVQLQQAVGVEKTFQHNR